MGFSLGGIVSSIGKVFKAGSAAVKTFGGSIGKGGGGFSTLGLIGQIGSSLMTKHAGGDGEWRPVDTSAGISTPSTGSFSMPFKKAGSGGSPDMRMKTVDGDTLTAEWEYRLKKSLRDKNLFS
jgi:hypothetical protein